MHVHIRPRCARTAADFKSAWHTNKKCALHALTHAPVKIERCRSGLRHNPTRQHLYRQPTLLRPPLSTAWRNTADVDVTVSCRDVTRAQRRKVARNSNRRLGGWVNLLNRELALRGRCWGWLVGRWGRVI